MFEREVVQLQGVRSAGPGVSCVALKAACITSRSQMLSFCVICFIKLRLRTVADERATYAALLRKAIEFLVRRPRALAGALFCCPPAHPSPFFQRLLLWRTTWGPFLFVGVQVLC